VIITKKSSIYVQNLISSVITAALLTAGTSEIIHTTVYAMTAKNNFVLLNLMNEPRSLCLSLPFNNINISIKLKYAIIIKSADTGITEILILPGSSGTTNANI
jgi:hypothetical protein